MLTHPTSHCRQETIHHPCGAEDWQSRSFITPVEMETVIEEVLRSLETSGFSFREIFAVRLVLEEAVMNAIRHGHRFDRSKHVHLRYHVTPECLLAEVEDEGPGFDPQTVPDPRQPEFLEQEGGRGLLLMQSYMTWVRYNERGTCVTMCKCRDVG